jgi:4-amino-4-deoxy-L-arabinose transferase-like glycosyltransferase
VGLISTAERRSTPKLKGRLGESIRLSLSRRLFGEPIRPDPGVVPSHKRGAATALSWSVVGLTSLLSLGLGLYHLGSRSLWEDEGFTWETASQPISKIWRISTRRGDHLFDYYLAVHLMIRAFGHGADMLRMPSVLAGVVTVPLVYLLASRLAETRVAGMFAAALFTVSAPMVFWQQNARDYAFVVLLAVSSSLLLTIAVQTHRAGYLFWWAVISALSVYTHPELALLVPVQVILFLAWSPTWTLRVALVTAGGIVGAIAYHPMLKAVSDPEFTNSSLPKPNQHNVAEVARFLASSAGTAAPNAKPDQIMLWITLAILVAAAGFMTTSFVEHGLGGLSYGWALVIGWITLPPVMSWVLAESGRPVFIDRYLILSLPPVSIAIAMVLVRSRPRILGFLALAYLLVFRFGVMAPTYSKPYDDYRAATEEILLGAQPHDCVTFDTLSGSILYDYYLKQVPHRGNLPAQVMPFGVNTSDPIEVRQYSSVPESFVDSWQSPVGVKFVASFCPRLWLLQSHTGSLTGSSSQRQLASQFGAFVHDINATYALQADKAFPGITVLLFSKSHHS